MEQSKTAIASSQQEVTNEREKKMNVIAFLFNLFVSNAYCAPFHFFICSQLSFRSVLCLFALEAFEDEDSHVLSTFEPRLSFRIVLHAVHLLVL